MKIYFNHSLEKKQLKTLLYWFHQRYGYCKTRDLADTLKTMGFHYATYAGISLGVDDLEIPPLKTQLVKNAERQVLKSDCFHQRGEITSIERFQKVIEAWSWTSENVKEEVLHCFKHYQKLNPVYMMAFSGARGNISQVRQLVGMRGLMSDPNGHLIDVPIKNNFREGLTIIEYVISCYGARKGIVDTALKTANSGYLTRRLVEAAQAVTIHNTDCHTNQGIFLSDLYDEEKKPSSSLEQRLIGRVLMEHLYLKTQSKTAQHHKAFIEGTATGGFPTSPYVALGHDGTQAKTQRRTLQRRYNHTAAFMHSKSNPSNQAFHAMRLGCYNEDIKPFQAAKIANDYYNVRVRSPLTCGTSHSKVCQLCYGWDLSQSRIVSLGEAVGMIAAQSIGEPGTQLTMRTFHTGGVFAGAVGQKVVAPSNGYVSLSDGVSGFTAMQNDNNAGGAKADSNPWEGLHTVFATERKRFHLSGRKVRTQLGENALVTYKSFYLALVSYETDASGWSNGQKRSTPPYTNAKATRSYTTIYRFPSQTLLFVTPGEWVEQKQIIAEIPEKADLQRRTYQTAINPSSADHTVKEEKPMAIASGEKSVQNHLQQRLSNAHEDQSAQTEESEEKVDVISDFSGQVFLPSLHTLTKVDRHSAYGGHMDRSTTRAQSGTSKPSEAFTPGHRPSDTGDETWKATEPSHLWVLSGTKFGTHLSFLRADKAFVADGGIGSLPWSSGEGHKNRENQNKSFEVRTSFVFFDKAHSTRNCDSNESKAPFATEGVFRGKDSAFRGVNAVTPEAIEPKGGNAFPESNGHNRTPWSSGPWSSGSLKGNACNHSSRKAYGVAQPKGTKSHHQIDLGVGKMVRQSNAGESCVRSKKHRGGVGQVDFTYLMLDESVQKGFCVPAVSLLSQKSDSLANGFNEEESTDKNESSSRALSSAFIPMTIGALVRKGGLIPIDADKSGLDNGNTKTMQGDGLQSHFHCDSGELPHGAEAFTSKVYKIAETSLITEIQCKHFNLFESAPKKEERTALPGGETCTPGSQNQRIAFKVRKVKPYLLSTGASSKLKQWQMVDACSHLFQLPYNREKTGDIVQGLPKIDQCFEARKKDDHNPKTLSIKNFFFFRKRGLSALLSSFLSFRNVQNVCVHSVQRVYQSQGISLSDKHIEIIVRRMTSSVFILHPGKTSLLPGEVVEYQFLRSILHYDDGHPKFKTHGVQRQYALSKWESVDQKKPVIFLPYVLGITKVSLSNYRTSFLSAASFQETRRILMNSALEGCIDYLDELKQPVMLGETIPAGIAFFYEQQRTIVPKA